MSAPLTRQERQAQYREAKGHRNARKRHPCPDCKGTGSRRRSFGFGVPGDPNSEAYVIEECRTCKTPAHHFSWQRDLRARARALTPNPAFDAFWEKIRDEVFRGLGPPRRSSPTIVCLEAFKAELGLGFPLLRVEVTMGKGRSYSQTVMPTATDGAGA